LSPDSIKTMRNKPKNHHLQSGFTLIEIMVVIVVLGIVAGSMVVSIRGKDPEDVIGEEAERLMQLIRLNQEEAVMAGAMTGLYFNLGNYYFLNFSDDTWSVVSEDKIFKPRKLPKGIELELEVEGELAQLDDADEELPGMEGLADSADSEEDESEDSDDGFGSDEKDQITPHVYIFPNGEMITFKLTMFTDDADGDRMRFEITGAFDGFVEMRGPLWNLDQ